MQAFDNGDVFPIWAECLGFELVSMLAAKRDLSSGIVDRKFFTKVDAQNISLPLHIPKGLFIYSISFCLHLEAQKHKTLLHLGVAVNDIPSTRNKEDV